jgi:hypothetical protein
MTHDTLSKANKLNSQVQECQNITSYIENGSDIPTKYMDDELKQKLKDTLKRFQDSKSKEFDKLK